MKGEKNPCCYSTEMRGTRSSNSSAATWTGEMGPVGRHSSDAKCLGCFCTHFCKTLITGSTVTLPTVSLAATKFHNLLFPSPLLPTQNSPAKPMSSQEPWRYSTWASHFRESWGTGCREQEGAAWLPWQGCLLSGGKLRKDEIKRDDINRIRQSLEVFNPFYSFSSPDLISRGNTRAILPYYRHFSGLILNPGWCNVKGSNTLQIKSPIPIFICLLSFLKTRLLTFAAFPLLRSLCRVPWDSWPGV